MGPSIQVIDETQYVETRRSCIALIKKTIAPRGTYFACPRIFYTCYPGEDCKLVFLAPNLDVLLGGKVQ